MKKEVRAISNNIKCHLLFATWLGCLSWLGLASAEIVLNQLYLPGRILKEMLMISDVWKKIQL